MTTDDCAPALPRGAAGCTGWELDGDELYRIVFTDEQRVDGCGHGVHLSALQYPDGTLSRSNPTEIYVYIAGDGPLSGAQSRALAQILLDAAEQADGWAARESTE